MKITKKLPIKNILNFHPELKGRTEEVLERKALVSNFTELQEGEAIGIISTPSVDNDGDIIDPMGIKTDIYNGTCQWNHCLDTLPLGTLTEWTITEEGVKGKFKFSSTYDYAIDVYNLVKEGVLKGISIGYIPLKTLKAGTSAFNEYAKAKGWDVTGCSRIITESLWIETSLVPVGCNNDSLILAAKNFKSEISFKNFKIDQKACGDKKPEQKADEVNETVVDVPVEGAVPEVIQETSVEDNVEVQQEVTIIEQGVTNEENIPEEVKQVCEDVPEGSKSEDIVKTEEIKKCGEEEKPKALVLKVLRKGKMQVTEDIKRKALLFIQGKSF